MGFLDLFRARRRETYDYGETIYIDADYRVTFRAGDPQKAILAFCGIGLGVGAVQIEEFRSSLGLMASVYFVADMKRSWWNDGLVEAPIAAAMDHARAREPNAAFSALGNSMGGSGAILAAHMYPEIERCLAFVPQADVRPTSGEKRWTKYRKRIAKHRWPEFVLPSRGASQKIIFGSDEDQHASARFKAAGFPVEVIQGANHRVAAHLRDAEAARYQELMHFVMME